MSRTLVTLRDALRAFALLGSVLAVSMVLGASAQAGVNHPLLSSFGSFSSVQGVAVDQATGDVYVLDTGVGGGSLFKFDASGKPLKFTGLPGEPFSITGLHGGSGSDNELAVDSSSGPAQGDVYVAVGSSNGNQIDVIAPDGESLGALTQSNAPWGETCGVAVDSTGSVYVGIYGGGVDKFAPTTNPVTNSDYVSTLVGVNKPCNLTTDNAGHVFAVKYGGGPVERYEASQFGGFSSFGSIVDKSGSTLAVDAADNHLYVDAGGQVSEFGAGGQPFEAPLTVFGHAGTQSFGIAVNQTSGDVYVSNGNGEISVYGPDQTFPDVSTQAPSGLTTESATLNGTVNPNGIAVSSCNFEYGTQSGVLATSVPCSPTPGSGSSPVSISAAVTGLKPATVYHYRLTITSVTGVQESQESIFKTLGPTEVLDEAYSNVGSSSATVSAQIRPGGQPTSFRVEYGTTSTYGSTTSSTSVGDGTEAVSVITRLDGLEPGVSYHFRFVSTNNTSIADGNDTTFSALVAAILGLPDNRGYEMVTPVSNEGIEVYAPFGSSSNQENEEVISTQYPVRAAADGDAVAYVGEPIATGNGSQGRNFGNEFIATRAPQGGWVQRDVQTPGVASPHYVSFSDDLSSSVLLSTEPLSAGVPDGYETLYTRDNSSGALQPLSTVTPHLLPNTSGIEGFGAADSSSLPLEGSLGHFYAGASQDFKRQFFEANDALTPNAVSGGEHENNLYESVEGALRLVNVLPNGETEPNASFGAPSLHDYEQENTTNVISADGSRVFWSDLNTGSLYVRENGTSTKLVAEDATFQTASTDGSRVLYTKSGDLYEDDLSTGTTADLTPAGQVLGIAGSSEDASYVYVVAQGSLAPGATTGESNLYLLHAGTTKFIATLGPESEENPTEVYGSDSPYIDWSPNLASRTAEAAPGGQALVFMSVRSLTGYDNIEEHGERVWEVYIYEANTGHLSCVSCSPSGEPPRSSGSHLYPFNYLDVPGQYGTFQLRSISEDGGRVFFQTTMPLVAQDVNGRRDVYEWERDGEGSCQMEKGCIYLISGGSSQRGSYFLDASADGSNVFFITGQKLVEQDENELYDVYDARVGAETPPTSPECTGSGCQGLPEAPPVFATPSSVTFTGVGNFAALAKSRAKSKTKKKAKRKVKKKKRNKDKQKSKRQGKMSKAKRSKPGARRAGGQ
ncbi:MAG: hypothetical protein WBV85_08130 [Solirubrobacteraceae bacterium]